MTDYKGFYIRKGNVGYDNRITMYFVQESQEAKGFIWAAKTLEEAKQLIDDFGCKIQEG